MLMEGVANAAKGIDIEAKRDTISGFVKAICSDSN